MRADASSGFTSSDNCVLTFRSQACLTISMEEETRAGPSSRPVTWGRRRGARGTGGVFRIVNPGVLQHNFIHLTHTVRDLIKAGSHCVVSVC